VTVLPFGDEEVARFCGQWCRASERVTDKSAAADARAERRARDLVDAIRAGENVHRLATNPLLLTIIALIHYQNVRLPERRVELYRLAVEALAESWNRARSLGGGAIDLYLVERACPRLVACCSRWRSMHQPSCSPRRAVRRGVSAKPPLDRPEQ